MYTYQLRTANKYIIESISIFPRVLCFCFDSNLGIRMGTIGILEKTHKVLTVKGQTDVSLRQHRPRTVLSFPTDWIPYAMRIRNKVTVDLHK